MSKRYAAQYLQERVVEMGVAYGISNFFELVENGVTWGIRATVFNVNNLYQSVYVYEDYRNAGYMTDYINNNKFDYPFITMKDCNIESWFVKHKVPYLLVTV